MPMVEQRCQCKNAIQWKGGMGEQRKTKLQLMLLLPISYLEKTLGPDFRWHDLLSNNIPGNTSGGQGLTIEQLGRL